MRAILIAAVAAVLGAVVAGGATIAEFSKPENPIPDIVSQPPVQPGQPRVSIEGGLTHDFGIMGMLETGKHTFIVKNVGDAPLVLTKGHTTCKCTLSEIEPGGIPKGETKEVRLEWTPKESTENFEQSAEIITNDPENPSFKLVIRGRVRETVKIEPNPAPLGQFSTNEPFTFDVRVYGYKDGPWKFEGFECAETETAEFFDIEARDLTDKELAKVEGPRNGQVLRIIVKPGMPMGNMHQTFRIKHNYEERGPVELHVMGKAVGDITIIGADWDNDREHIALDNVPSSEGKKTKLFLVVKGAHREETTFKVKSIEPESVLKVELGEPTGQGGKTMLWPLTIEIPKGAEPINRLGNELGRMARIEFETTHPDTPSFTLKLRFAITAEQ
jgi:hypothetical protein